MVSPAYLAISKRYFGNNVVKGKNMGLKGVRIKTVRSKGNFDIRHGDKILSVSRNHIQPIHRRDGYNYS
ncbi:MAG: hypothetical protein F6K17_41340, partial [Okeania sp. SIO3C4]|nr:hypothetical protein [Okeania sp. SIO3C4]